MQRKKVAGNSSSRNIDGGHHSENTSKDLEDDDGQDVNSAPNWLPFVVVAFFLLMLSTLVTLFVIADISHSENATDRLLVPDSVLWTPSTLVDLMSHGKPVIVKNAPFMHWPCINWTWNYLRDSVRSDLPVKVSSFAEFKYSTPNKPFSGAASPANAVNYTNVVMAGKRLFQLLHEGTSGQFMYASGDVSLLGRLGDFGDRSQVTFPSDMDNDAQINFWFGSSGVTAEWHYDTSENLHAMVSGKKTFLLYPPSAFRGLGLYPSVHHFYRQAQVRRNDSLARKNVGANMYKVTLKAGEVLYIPPYWFHSVQSHTSSISVNAWSHSEAFLAMEKIYSLPIALESDWSRCKMFYGAWLFVDEILRQTLDDTERKVFLSLTLASRYDQLLDPALDNSDRDAASLKQCAEEARSKQLVSRQELDAFKSSVTSRVGDHVMLFLSMSRDVRAINLGNFVEHLYSLVVGEDHQEQIPDLLRLKWK